MIRMRYPLRAAAVTNPHDVVGVNMTIEFPESSSPLPVSTWLSKLSVFPIVDLAALRIRLTVNISPFDIVGVCHYHVSVRCEIVAQIRITI